MGMSYLNDTPRRAPKNYKELEPCEEKEEDIIWVGSGVRWENHPKNPADIHWVGLPPDCRNCESRDVLVIYLASAPNIGAGKDLNVEVECQECGKFSYHTYID